MKSFDVFDTLIARRYVRSDTIWKKMGEEIDIPNFEFHRKQCNYGPLRNIYTQLANRGVIPHHLIDQMMEYEVQYEEDVCFPIKETMEQVSHGDLLVSDMYLPPADILRLVRTCGLDKQVTIHASLADKQHGTFWKAMRGHLSLESHTGDNGHADIKLAAQEGFKVVHYVKSEQTKTEKELEAKGLKELSMLVRETRLRNHEHFAEIFAISNQLNLPWIFVCCELLRRKHPNKKPVFLGRDCQLFYKIFNTYFSEASYYLPFSRRAAYKDPRAAVQYIKSHVPENYILVDISSTGKTWNMIGQHHVFDIEILHYDHRNDIPVPKNFTWFNKDYSGNGRGTNLLLEIFNCADHGMMDEIRLVNGLSVAKFDPSYEIDPEHIKAIHQPFKTALELKKHYYMLKGEMSQIDEKTLWYFFDVLPRSICVFQDSLRDTVFKGFYEKHKEYLTELMVKLRY